MDNFDLKKYLVENKLTSNSKLIKEQEETSPEVKAQLAAKAERLANSPAIKKQIEDVVKKLTPAEQQTIVNFVKEINESLTENKLAKIADKLEDTGIDFSKLEESTLYSAGIVGPISQLAVAWGLIKGILLDGGPEALAVVGPPVATVLAISAVILAAETIINHLPRKEKSKNNNDTPSEPTTNNTGMNPKVLVKGRFDK